MRGLRLFVRPIETSDAEAVGSFLAKQVEDRQFCLSEVAGEAGTGGSACPPPLACGLLGKLLGDIVAVVAMDLTDDALRVDDIIVARDLRRKRIGRVMMREVEQLAKKLDRGRVVIDDARGAQEFLERVGFRIEGERWVRVVSS